LRHSGDKGEGGGAAKEDIGKKKNSPASLRREKKKINCKFHWGGGERQNITQSPKRAGFKLTWFIREGC